MLDIVSYLAGAFTVCGIIAVVLCMSATRISAGDYTRFHGLDRLHK